MSRQFRRLQRIRLKTTAQRAVPADFMARMLAAHHAHPWAGRARGFARRRPLRAMERIDRAEDIVDRHTVFGINTRLIGSGR